MAKIKPITLEIDEEIWKKYKKTVPRDQRLNDSVIELIKDKVDKFYISNHRG